MVRDVLGMPTEKQIREVVAAAKASLTNELYHPTMTGLRALTSSNMSDRELLKSVPTLARFVAKGMAAQQAAEAVIAEFNASQNS